eukprot:TRINITY_DN3976_c0_g1_i2.p1 TRINITY_DN3976_c0_g1~~TRINITY_DN3976_c0_g1_i2.p1  ORF type:complete len:1387 (-),score=279.77 TRINITY_DN3976_c0_g1_i2:138-4298(-)
MKRLSIFGRNRGYSEDGSLNDEAVSSWAKGGAPPDSADFQAESAGGYPTSGGEAGHGAGELDVRRGSVADDGWRKDGRSENGGHSHHHHHHHHHDRGDGASSEGRHHHHHHDRGDGASSEGRRHSHHHHHHHRDHDRSDASSDGRSEGRRRKSASRSRRSEPSLPAIDEPGPGDYPGEMNGQEVGGLHHEEKRRHHHRGRRRHADEAVDAVPFAEGGFFAQDPQQQPGGAAMPSSGMDMHYGGPMPGCGAACGAAHQFPGAGYPSLPAHAMNGMGMGPVPGTPDTLSPVHDPCRAGYMLGGNHQGCPGFMDLGAGHCAAAAACGGSGVVPLQGCGAGQGCPPQCLGAGCHQPCAQGHSSIISFGPVPSSPNSVSQGYAPGGHCGGCCPGFMDLGAGYAASCGSNTPAPVAGAFDYGAAGGLPPRNLPPETLQAPGSWMSNAPAAAAGGGPPATNNTLAGVDLGWAFPRPRQGAVTHRVQQQTSSASRTLGGCSSLDARDWVRGAQAHSSKAAPPPVDLTWARPAAARPALWNGSSPPPLAGAAARPAAGAASVQRGVPDLDWAKPANGKHRHQHQLPDEAYARPSSHHPHLVQSPNPSERFEDPMISVRNSAAVRLASTDTAEDRMRKTGVDEELVKRLVHEIKEDLRKELQELHETVRGHGRSVSHDDLRKEIRDLQETVLGSGVLSHGKRSAVLPMSSKTTWGEPPGSPARRGRQAALNSSDITLAHTDSYGSLQQDMMMGDGFGGLGQAGGGQMQQQQPPPSAWLIERHSMEHYDDVFLEVDRNGNGFIDGSEARMVLDRTGLPEEVLASIWRLSDVDQDGRLSHPEFVCAMHLAQVVKRGFELPAELPHELYAAASAQENGVHRVRDSRAAEAIPGPPSPPSPPAGPESSAVRTRPNSPIQGSAAPRGMPAAAASNAASSPWSLSAAEVAAFVQSFHSFDHNGFNSVGPQEGREHFEGFGLPVHELIQVWRMADLDKDGRLAVAEFVCAMALLTRRQAGLLLPDELPAELLAQVQRDIIAVGGGCVPISQPLQPQPLQASAQLAAVQQVAPPSLLQQQQQQQQHPSQAQASMSPACAEYFGHMPEDWRHGGFESIWSLSHQEISRYRSVFYREADVENKGYADPMATKELFEHSGLDTDTLRTVYQRSDLDADGFLSLPEFICAMALVARVVHGESIPYQVPMELLSTLPPPPPPTPPMAPRTVVIPAATMGSFDGQEDVMAAAMPSQPALELPAAQGSFEESPANGWRPPTFLANPEAAAQEQVVAAVATWAPSPEELDMYRAVYEGLGQQPSGADQACLLERSGLAHEELGRLWAMADQDGDGVLAPWEFVSAMALISGRRRGQALPEALPHELQLLGMAAASSSPSPAQSLPAGAWPSS